MGRLRLVQAACGFGQRALSGFFIDLILARHFDRGALLTPAVVVSFYANARKAFRSRTIGVSATRVPRRGIQMLPLRRCAWRIRRLSRSDRSASMFGTAVTQLRCQRSLVCGA